MDIGSTKGDRKEEQGKSLPIGHNLKFFPLFAKVEPEMWPKYWPCDNQDLMTLAELTRMTQFRYVLGDADTDKLFAFVHWLIISNHLLEKVVEEYDRSEVAKF